MKSRNIWATMLAALLGLIVLMGESSARSNPSIIHLDGWTIEKKPRPEATREEAQFQCMSAGKTLIPLSLLMKAVERGLLKLDLKGEWSDLETNEAGTFAKRPNLGIAGRDRQNRHSLPYRCAVQVSVSL